ncbi:MAG: hypothetical protein ACTHWH_05890 [Marinobacter sp.]
MSVSVGEVIHAIKPDWEDPSKTKGVALVDKALPPGTLLYAKNPVDEPFILRSQAKKLEEIATLIKQADSEGLSTVESIYEGLVLNSTSLRNEADNLEKGDGLK